MNIRLSLCILVTCGILAACSTTSVPPVRLTTTPHPCNGATSDDPADQCVLTLYIDEKGALQVNFDPVYVYKKNAKMTWVAPDGYEFHKVDGVLLKDPSNDEDNTPFSKKSIADKDGNGSGDKKGKYYVWHNKNNHKADYEYEVHVYPIGGSTPLILDPTIKNQG